jgi:glycosyltransferase involved in cell wall biosynthesis
MFVSLLLKQQWRVLVLTPDSDALNMRLMQNLPVNLENLQILDWNAHLQSFWQMWNNFGDQYFYKRNNSASSIDLPYVERVKRSIYHFTIPFLYRLTCFIHYRYKKLTIKNKKNNDEYERDLASPAEFSRRVQAAVKKAQFKPILALNMYMDAYKTSQSHWDEFSNINNIPWVGIQFVPTSSPKEAWYEYPLWRGMCVLDEAIAELYSSSLPHKSFIYLPDITESSLPTAPCDTAIEIRKLARNRTIVFLGGSIGGQKNLSQWFKVIKLADPNRWFFVQIGEIHRGTLTECDLDMLNEVMESPPENFYVRAQYLDDERDFNSVINACDIIFAVYRNFKISSNMLGKAAHFRKPILVSDKYLLGKRVLKYKIGYVANENDAAAMLSLLEEIRRNPIENNNFDCYCNDFSLTELSIRLNGFLVNCLR